MYNETNTSKYQHQLADFCRTGDYTPIPGVTGKNVGRYRELIYNVFDDSLQAVYPLTFNLLLQNEWDEMVDAFIRSHRCQSPLLWQMPGEFYAFITEGSYPLIEKYPFLPDLLLLEWKEVEVFMMEDTEPWPFTKTGYNNAPIVLNPELRVLFLTYPVHLKKAKEIAATDKGNYFVSLHREPKEGRVLFTSLQWPHVKVIEELSEKPMPFNKLLKIFSHFAPGDQAQQALTEFIQASLITRLILGYTLIPPDIMN